MDILETSLATLPHARGRWALTLGTFDGVHRGHQAILGEARRLAAAHRFDGATALTFARHPRAMLEPHRRPRILTSLDEKIQLLRAAGLDRLVILEFDPQVAGLEYDEFVRRVLVDALGMAHFVLGHDVHFGKGRGGTLVTVAALAEKEGFTVSQVASVRHENEPISSTRIRDSVARGRLLEAARMMGHPYPLRGTVVAGRGAGHELGFPTANVEPAHAAKLLPAVGVYAGWGRASGAPGWHPAAINVGRAPTLVEQGPVRVEAHLLDGRHDLRGREVELAFASKIRDEIRFPDADALVGQLQADAVAVARCLESAEAVTRAERLDRLGDDDPAAAPPRGRGRQHGDPGERS
jgi:riboflavin kinase/FMN adenylyltransferase